MNDSPAKAHDGKVVSMIGDKLTTTCDAGNQHCHTVAKDAKVTCDGKACKATDLKKGMRIRVTTEKKAPHSATNVEALDKTTEFSAL